MIALLGYIITALSYFQMFSLIRIWISFSSIHNFYLLNTDTKTQYCLPKS